MRWENARPITVFLVCILGILVPNLVGTAYANLGNLNRMTFRLSVGDDSTSQDAIWYFEQAIRWLPDSQRIQLNLGIYYAAAGETLAAVEACSKIWDYVGAYRFILTVAPQESRLAQLVSSEHLGVVVDPDDIEAIASTILHLIGMHRQGALTIQPSAEFLEKASRTYSEKQLACVLDSVLKEANHLWRPRFRHGVFLRILFRRYTPSTVLSFLSFYFHHGGF